MARLPQLISALSSVDGRRVSTIEHGSRVLREDGLLVSGKRGVGAAEMGFDDAANLLIAVNSADTLVDAPSATRLMRSLQPAAGVNEHQPYPLPDIELQQNFGDALGWVIMGAPHLLRLFDKEIDSNYGPPYTDKDRAALRRQVRLGMGPIVFRVEMARTFARLVAEWVDASPKIYWQRSFYLPPDSDVPRAFQADRTVRVEVGMLTLIALHECVSGKSIPTNSDGETEGK